MSTKTTVHEALVRVRFDGAAIKPGAQEAAKALSDLGAQATQAGQQGAAGLGRIAPAAATAAPAVRPVAEGVEKIGPAARRAGRETTEALGTMGMSAKQTAAAMRMLPAQMTDITVGLATGQSPFMVMMQQGGQLKDMFGGIAPALRAVGGAALGMVNPLTLAAAGVAGMVAAYNLGAREGDGYVRALVMTGNAAGVTASQMHLMAQSMDAVVGTQSAAAGALTALAATGQVAGNDLQRLGETTVRMQRSMGIAVSDTAAVFAELGKEPVRASERLNEATNYLTLATYEQIRALVEQGETDQAASVAQRAYADAMDQRAAKLDANLGTIERAWRAVGDSAREAWDEILGIGRPDGPGAGATPWKAASFMTGMFPMLGPVAMGGALGSGLRRGVRDAFTSDAEREAEAENARLAKRAADTQAAHERQAAIDQKAGIEAAQRVQAREKAARTAADKRKEEIDQLDRDRAALQRAGKAMSDADYQAQLAAINRTHKDPGGARGRDTSRVDAAAQLGFDIEGIRKQAGEQLDIQANAERILQAQRSAGLVDERGYYEARRALIQANTEVQVQALQAQNARLEQEKLNTKDSLDRDRQVLANKAQIAKLQADATTQQTLLDIQAASALKAREMALLSARQAAEAYLETSERQQQRELAGFGQGGRQRELNAGIAQIEDRYGAQRLDLAQEEQRLRAEQKWDEQTQENHTKRLEQINEFQAKATQSYVAYYARLRELEGDWTNGAREAMADYLDDAANVAAQSKEAFENAFTGLEDALVSFVTTGKADFKSLANSIIADIVRMQARAAMASVIGGAGGSSGWLTSLVGAFGGMSGGNAAAAANVMGGSDTLGTMIGLMGLAKNAKGGVYDSPSLSAYTNGVYDRPQLFAFAKGAGMFGEAGPEAIMPLKRDAQGRLGVSAEGAGQGGAGLVFAPQTSLHVDARADRGQVMADMNQLLARNNKAQMEQLQRMRVVPA